MPKKQEIAAMAHLLRRAGFGATRDELERYVAQGYEATVEELLHPEDGPPALDDEDLIRRYHVDQNGLLILDSCQAYWLYRMVNTKRPLEEKMALFWHGIFATGYTKLNQPKVILNQVEMLRRLGLGSFRELLTEISRDPAMIFWLDNGENHKDAVNENFGREILELFTMGVGNYTEDDVRQCSRAFTGWTIKDAALHAIRTAQDSVWPYGRLDWHHEYRDEDHDHDEKSFLGELGAHGGEDVIEIICRQPSTARFISRHLYSFFVADEPQVPAWQTVEPRDPDAIETLSEAFVRHDYDIRSVLRVLFNSDFFKNAAFSRVKSPVELVVGTARMSGAFRFPDLADIQLALQTGFMGQQILDPPSVEGWHTGREWINTANLVNRINFAVDQFSNTDVPGVRAIIDRVMAVDERMTPERLVEACLDQMGPVEVAEHSARELVDHAAEIGSAGDDGMVSLNREIVAELLQLIAATREYQMA
ncbi:MAG: DUF1800 domain-containing protein [Chloroflexi bacterium]|nr:DUF1800 domain-containing protein [Chloroflexota bacterium]